MRGDADEAHILELRDWSEAAQACIHEAFREARARGHPHVGVPHLLHSLRKEAQVARCLAGMRLDLIVLGRAIEQALLAAPSEWTANPSANERLLAVINGAVERGRSAKVAAISSGDLLLAIAEHDPQAQALLQTTGYSHSILLSLLAHGSEAPPAPDAKLPAGDTLEVVVHNDDYTPQDLVVAIFVDELNLDPARAHALMLEVHTTGQATVLSLPREQAIERARRASQRARAAGAPLRITLRAAAEARS
ncbi:MAG: ATP-dependent Clp protease adaptor ClpS [Deltaproteobacteria bacterium]|nr:ATP-dependent Clp protease adaptor ClpS [Deltaproteobacteria bacterium]